MFAPHLVDDGQVTTHRRISSHGTPIPHHRSSSPWTWRVTQVSIQHGRAGTLSDGCSRRPSLSLVTCSHYQTRSRLVLARTPHAETCRRLRAEQLHPVRIPIHSHPWFSRPRHDVCAVLCPCNSPDGAGAWLVPARPRDDQDLTQSGGSVRLHGEEGSRRPGWPAAIGEASLYVGRLDGLAAS